MSTRKNRTIRADIPADVWERFREESVAKGIPMGRHLRNLLVNRDRKRQAADKGVGK